MPAETDPEYLTHALRRSGALVGDCASQVVVPPRLTYGCRDLLL